MDYINNYPERMNVNSFSAGYDQETGDLTGNMVINLFGVKDADHKYEEPYISGMMFGVESIFGNLDFTPIDNDADNTSDNTDAGEPAGENDQPQDNGEGNP